MNILIPMAGAGSRFTEAGYKLHKPIIPTTSLKLGKVVPMVVAAILDLPKDASDSLILIDRDFHKNDGAEDEIKEYFPHAHFITIDHLTSGQATTCLLAKQFINNDQELLIAGCDNGMIINEEKFDILKKETSCIIFTHRNHELIEAKPEAYGWVKVDNLDNVLDVSVKKTISNNPLNDHAIVATFWFKHGADFVKCAEEMILKNDRINNEFYVDQVINYIIKNNIPAKVFEVDRYLCWGTPVDFENYENTVRYWSNFLNSEKV